MGKKRVCIIGCGAIGSLYAAHLARVADVYAFVRRQEHARALAEQGLRVSGGHGFTASLRATTQPKDLPCFDFGLVCTKATQTAAAVARVGHL
ncbi:MAG: ketopantoate reductase family protein, partial [Terriglobia bacterium]